MQTFARIFSILVVVAFLSGCQTQSRGGGVSSSRSQNNEPSSKPIASADAGVDSIASDRENVDPEVDRLSKELAALRARLVELQDRDERLANRVVELNRQVELQQEQMKAAGTALNMKDKMEKQITDLTVQVQVLTRENTGLRRLLTMSSADAGK